MPDVYLSIAGLLDADAKNVSWKYYMWNLPQQGGELSCDVRNGLDVFEGVRYGPDWKKITTPNTKIFQDLSNGTLPAVSRLTLTLVASDH